MRVRQLRQAFIGSAVSLVLCCAMLAGTTYAWFAEHISSGVQTIQAGNLDVQLRYKRGLDESWKEVTVEDSETESVKAGIDNLFPDKIWKPGDVEYVFLEVTNTGSLPVSYQLTVGEDSDLLQWLEAGCIQGEWYKAEDYQTASPSNAEMIELVEADSLPIADEYQLSGELEDGREIITLVLYMPSDSGTALLESDAGVAGTAAADKAEFYVTFNAAQQAISDDEEAGES